MTGSSAEAIEYAEMHFDRLCDARLRAFLGGKCAQMRFRRCVVCAHSAEALDIAVFSRIGVENACNKIGLDWIASWM